MRFKFIGYSSVSKSLSDLSKATGFKRLYRPPNVRIRSQDVIFNWGCSTATSEKYGDLPYGVFRYTNTPEAVCTAVDKRQALRVFKNCDIPTVDYTTSQSSAYDWLAAGSKVLARTTSRGHGGFGIDVFSPTPEDMARFNQRSRPYEFYSKYFKKRSEYRVHVWHNPTSLHDREDAFHARSYKILHVQEKRLKTGTPITPLTYAIRSHNQGWVFCQENVDAPTRVLEAAIDAVRSLRLWFGAVDVGYNQHYNRPAVFEVNTAPGLEGTTFNLYVQQFLKLQQEITYGNAL